MISGLHHVQLAMPKSGASRAGGFCGGLPAIPEGPKPVDLQGNGGCWFGSGTVRIHPGVAQDFRPARKAHPVSQAEDFDKLMEKLEYAGYLVHSAGAINRHARRFVDGPFGNRIECINVENDL